MPATLYLAATPDGIFPTSIDDIGILVLTERFDPENPYESIGPQRRDRLFIAAFRQRPGDVFAVVSKPDGKTETVTRAEAMRRAGVDVVEVCTSVAGEMAERTFPEWEEEATRRDSALHAVLTSIAPAEA